MSVAKPKDCSHRGCGYIGTMNFLLRRLKIITLNKEWFDCDADISYFTRDICSSLTNFKPIPYQPKEDPS